MKKETIIFLHGMVGNKNAFKKEMDKLKGEYHCISYDFYDPKDLGDGSQLSIEFLIDQLYSKYMMAGIEKAHLCTLSFGCVVAMAFAKKYPNMVISMTYVGGYLCNPPSQLYRNFLQVLEIKQMYDDHEMWIKQCAKLLNQNHDVIVEDSENIFIKYALQVTPEIFEKGIQIQLVFDSKTVLANMDIPILWVMGKYDQLYKSTFTNLKDYIPHVKYYEIEGAGHAAHVHQHEKFMSIFQAFLEKDKSMNHLTLS